jgi:GT2 family glycosyltransferase
MGKKMFFELGGFLPIFKPFYYEDCDLDTRAWHRGWKTIFEPESTIIHDHEGTISRLLIAKKIKIIKRRNKSVSPGGGAGGGCSAGSCYRYTELWGFLGV